MEDHGPLVADFLIRLAVEAVAEAGALGEKVAVGAHPDAPTGEGVRLGGVGPAVVVAGRKKMTFLDYWKMHFEFRALLGRLWLKPRGKLIQIS